MPSVPSGHTDRHIDDQSVSLTVLQELLKLRKKITSTVQVLTHLKEKLQFVQGENLIHKGKLQEVEATVGQVSRARVLLIGDRECLCQTS